MRATTSIAGSRTVHSSTLVANLDPPMARWTRPARSSWSRPGRQTSNLRERDAGGCRLVDAQHDLGVVGDGLDAQTAGRRSRTARRSAVVTRVACVEPSHLAAHAHSVGKRPPAAHRRIPAITTERLAQISARCVHSRPLRSRVAYCTASTSRREAAADAPLRLHLLNPDGAAVRPRPVSIQVDHNLLPSGGWRVTFPRYDPLKLEVRPGPREARRRQLSAAPVSTAQRKPSRGRT